MPFTEEEVHPALADLNGDKAPEPNGFTTAFWQFSWDHSCEKVHLGAGAGTGKAQPRPAWARSRPLHTGAQKIGKACAFNEARSSPQACLRAGKSSSSDPLLLPLPLPLPLHFSLFSASVGNCRNESSCFLQIRPKRHRLVSLGHKTTSFWPFYFFLKPIQNDVVLDLSHLSNDVVLHK